MPHCICHKCNNCHKCAKRSDDCRRIPNSDTSRAGHCNSGSSRSSSATEPFIPEIDFTHVIRQNDTGVLCLEPDSLSRLHAQDTISNALRMRNITGHHHGQPVMFRYVHQHHRGVCSIDHPKMSRVVAVQAAQIVAHFMEDVDIGKWTIYVNMPTRAEIDLPGHRNARKTVKVTGTIEPYIDKIVKYNCNNGWISASDKSAARILNALSHYSYFISERTMLLCNLKAGVDRSSKTIIITDPTILTRSGGQFGCADRGKGHMKAFLENHECNDFCQFYQPHKNDVIVRPNLLSTVGFN